MGSDPHNILGKYCVFMGTKLSNSGELLKLLVPNHSRKVVSGWTNYPGMVTSQEINKSLMENRGSKSDGLFSLSKYLSVKEQRVDGSWYDNYLSYLRCTLMGRESVYLIKNLSKQLNN